MLYRTDDVFPASQKFEKKIFLRTDQPWFSLRTDRNFQVAGFCLRTDQHFPGDKISKFS